MGSWGVRGVQNAARTKLSPLSFGMRRVCVLASISIFVLAASLSALGAAVDTLFFALAIAVALLVVAAFPPGWSNVRRATLVVLVCGFVVARCLTATGSVTRAALQIALEVTILSVTPWFALRSVDGLERLASLIPDASDGYASLLDRDAAVPRFEADLARSRRSGEPLSLVVLERAGTDAAADEFFGAVGQLPHSLLSTLEREYTRARMCALISVHVRRSDVVAVDSDEGLLLLCSGTNGDGAAQLAGRIVHNAEVSLGVPLVAGVAACPGDGLDLDELSFVAKKRARSPHYSGEAITNGRSDPGSERAPRSGVRRDPTVVQGGDSGL